MRSLAYRKLMMVSIVWLTQANEVVWFIGRPRWLVSPKMRCYGIWIGNWCPWEESSIGCVRFTASDREVFRQYLLLFVAEWFKRGLYASKWEVNTKQHTVRPDLLSILDVRLGRHGFQVGFGQSMRGYRRSSKVGWREPGSLHIHVWVQYLRDM